MMAAVEPDQDIIIQISQNFKGITVSAPRIRKLVETICSRFSGNNSPEACGKGARYEISIAIVNDVQFRELNSRYLNRRSSSDCLSFDLSDDGSGASKLFEIVVNGEIAVKQANLRGHSEEAELALYITHGLLHNLGFNDSTASKAQKMHVIEDEILQQLGYGLVYNKSISAQENTTGKNQ